MEDKQRFVDDFLRRYAKEYDFFDRASRLAAQILDGRLRDAGIRSIVTSRAKAVRSLEVKVKARASERNYASTQDIFDDIVDLAGVRVAMYFPGQWPQVDNVVRSLFDLETDPKEFPTSTKKPPREKRFPGYFARHYRVRLKEKLLSEGERRYAVARIEIQVASVLMHSWAEVEHDLIYKPQQGELSDEEYETLDELNGLVITGEIALQRLQKAGESRVAVGGRSFSNHYELASHLLNASVSVIGESIAVTDLGRIDVLFELLKRLNLATPDLLKPYIAALRPDLEIEPLADQIIDQVVKEDKERYKTYESLRSTPSGDGPRSPTQRDAVTEQELNEFLDAWVALEQKVNQMAKGTASEGIYPSRALLERLGVKDKNFLKDFEKLRRMRNGVVHGLMVPPASDLEEAGRRIREIAEQLDHLN